MSDYKAFLANKRVAAKPSGFDIAKADLNPLMKPWQADITQWALKRGKSALFWDTGLGKTFAQLEWARCVFEHTGKPVLILAPILVGWQTIEEAAKFGINAPIKYVQDGSEVIHGINVTNYERLHKFDLTVFAGVVLDEAGILKNYMGQRKRAIIAGFSRTPFKLAATATPAPNDLLELGNQADFLDVMPSNEMIARWFIADSMHAGCYRLKHHGKQDYWRWVSSWAVSLGLPSDIGGDDTGYDLPPLTIHERIVESRSSWFGGKTTNSSATNVHHEKRSSLEDRCQAVADLANASIEQWAIWCGTDYEADVLKRVVNDSVEIRGKHSEAEKERGIKAFQGGDVRNIITKARLAGWGLNWQHCHNTTWFASYSFEEMYQAFRRLYRFGQKHEVNGYLIASEQEIGIVDSVKKKAERHQGMKCEIAEAMREFQIAEVYGTKLEKYETCQELKLPSWLSRSTTNSTARS